MFNTNAELSTAFETTEQREPDFDGNNECGIPMIVFSPSNEGEDAARETAVDECDDDCESFTPTDLMTFAWQIARGMVRISLCINKLTDFISSSVEFVNVTPLLYT